MLYFYSATNMVKKIIHYICIDIAKIDINFFLIFVIVTLLLTRVFKF